MFLILNGQNSSWTSVNAGVPQGYIPRPLQFFININDLADELSPNVKLFADDSYIIISVVHDVNTSARELNDDLKNIKISGLSNGK